MADDPERPSSGWRWSDDILIFRVKVVAVMTVAVGIGFAAYAVFWR